MKTKVTEEDFVIEKKQVKNKLAHTLRRMEDGDSVFIPHERISYESIVCLIETDFDIADRKKYITFKVKTPSVGVRVFFREGFNQTINN